MRFLLAAALSLAPMAAVAQDDSPEQIALEARHGYMLMAAANMGPLAAMAKGEMPYDEALAVRYAMNLDALGNYEVEMHFIPGTAQGEIEDSEALPKIWDNLADVQKKHVAFTEAAAAAPEGVKGGPENVAKTVQQLGATCKACHDEYRAK